MSIGQFSNDSRSKLRRYLSIETISLAFFVTTAFLLRFYQLGSESLWIDELLDWGMSTQATLPELFDEAARTAQVPTYYLFFRFYTMLFGDSEVVLRLLPATAGTLAIPALYYLGRKLYNSHVGLIAASLASTSKFLIWHAQEFRPYSFLFLFSILSVSSLTTLLNSNYKKSEFIFYTFTFVVLSQLHYFGYFFALLQLTVLLFSKKVERGSLSLLASILFLITALNYNGMYYMLYYTAAEDPSGYLKLYPASLLGTVTTFWNSFCSVKYLTTFLGTLHIIMPFLIYKRSYRSCKDVFALQKLTLLLAWTFVPLIIFWLVQGGYKGIGFPPRYLIFCQPALYILSGLYLQRLLSKQTFALLTSLAFIPVGMFHLIYVDHYYEYINKTPFKQALEEASLSIKWSQAEVFINGAPGRYLSYYLKKYPVKSIDNLTARNRKINKLELPSKKIDDYADHVILIETKRTTLGEQWKREMLSKYELKRIPLEQFRVFEIFSYQRLTL